MLNHLVQVLPQFLLACLVLTVIPGPAIALCLHRTLRDGRAAGLAAAGGNVIGIFGWALAGGAGISVLLAANRALSDALHVVTGLVLVALGVQAWRGGGRPGTDGLSRAQLRGGLPRGDTPSAAFRASLVSIAANPKAAVFAVSFLPQFFPRNGPLLPTLMTLACVQVLIDSVWTGGLVLLADRVRGKWHRATVRMWLERSLGAILVALGLNLAIDR